MARATLAEILARVRLLVNDRGTPPTFSDDELADTLDQRRSDFFQEPLQEQVTYFAGKPAAWLDYYAPFDLQWWEGDVQLYANTFAPITPATSDLSGGHWTFTTSQNPPVYITGKLFDLYAAAADVLDLWIAQLKLEYDTRQDQRNQFMRQQRITTMTDLAASYRAKQQPQSVTMTRPDTVGANGGGMLMGSFTR
jgi:hypothetical protein